MTAKSLLTVSALALLSLGTASAKSYDIVLSSPAKAGAVELKPGEYKLKVEGSQAIFTDAEDAKSYSVPITIENNQKKFAYTAVESTNQNGVEDIQSIDLGGSSTRLTLGK